MNLKLVGVWKSSKTFLDKLENAEKETTTATVANMLQNESVLDLSSVRMFNLSLDKIPEGQTHDSSYQIKKKKLLQSKMCPLFDAFRSDSTHSTQLGVCSLSQFIVWKSIFWPQQSAALHPVSLSLSICAGVFPAPWGTPPALPWVYPCCHGNTLQSHRPKYPKLRIISWRDVSERVPYRARRVSAVLATAAAHSALDRKVWLLTFKKSGWKLDSALCCHTPRKQSSSELYAKPICNLFS